MRDQNSESDRENLNLLGGVQNQGGRRVMGSVARGLGGLALSDNRSLWTLNNLASSQSIDGEHRSEQGATRNDSITNQRQEMFETGASWNGAGRGHSNCGCQRTCGENNKDELMAIRANLNAHNEDIQYIINTFGDVRNLMQAIFSTYNRNEIDAIKTAFADRLDGSLKQMIEFAEGFMSAKAAASNTATDLCQNNDETGQENQFKVVKSSMIPFNKIITKDRKSNGSPGSDSPNPPNSSNGRIRFDNPAAAEANGAQQQAVNERRQKQEELLRKREAEKRKKNIIIEGVSETIWGEAGDKAIIEDMLRDMGLYQRIHELETTDRIGRIRDNGRPRLIVATFSSVSAAYEITYKGYRLFNNDRFQNVYVRRDLSKREREEERAKRQNKKRASDMGNVDVSPENGSEEAQEAGEQGAGEGSSTTSRESERENEGSSLSDDTEVETETEEEDDETDVDSDMDTEHESASEDESASEGENESGGERESENEGAGQDVNEEETEEVSGDQNVSGDTATGVEENENGSNETNETEISNSTGSESGLPNTEEQPEAPDHNESNDIAAIANNPRESRTQTRSRSRARTSGNGSNRKETLPE